MLAEPSLVINEVLYDPPGADGGFEFVEIINADTVVVHWSSLTIEAGDGAQGTWKRLWQFGPGSLPPAALLLVAGDAVPDASHRLHGALQNGPDAVRLLRDAQVIDRVGYGALEDSTLFEGRPCEDVAGRSLARIPDAHDTQDNRHDLQPHTPTPGRANQPRHEWQLQIREPAWHRLWPHRWLRVPVNLVNRGVVPSAPSDWQLQVDVHTAPVEACDALRGTAPLPEGFVDLLDVPEVLAAGDSATFHVRWTAALGAFRVVVRAAGSDAWQRDNVDSLCGRVGPGAVLLHEVLFAPRAGEPEWVELRNRGATSVDLQGWTLADASGRRATLHTTRLLEPDSFAVLRQDPTEPIAGEPPSALRVRSVPWPSLNNTAGDDGIADLLVLRDAQGQVQDAMFYTAAQAVRGRSLERAHEEPTVRGVIWGTSKHPRGATPGAANTLQGGVATRGHVQLHPNPMTPDGDGSDDVLHIQLEVPVGASGYRAQLFDRHGVRRRRLGADQLGPGPRLLLWEGEDDAGVPVETGVYLLHFEWFENGRVRRQLFTVGVAR